MTTTYFVRWVGDRHAQENPRRVFLLYYHHELPIKAIAAEIGRSEGTIKTHLRNARLQLRELLTPYMENRHVPWLA